MLVVVLVISFYHLNKAERWEVLALVRAMKLRLKEVEHLTRT